MKKVLSSEFEVGRVYCNVSNYSMRGASMLKLEEIDTNKARLVFMNYNEKSLMDKDHKGKTVLSNAHVFTMYEMNKDEIMDYMLLYSSRLENKKEV